MLPPSANGGGEISTGRNGFISFLAAPPRKLNALPVLPLCPVLIISVKCRPIPGSSFRGSHVGWYKMQVDTGPECEPT